MLKDFLYLFKFNEVNISAHRPSTFDLMQVYNSYAYTVFIQDKFINNAIQSTMILLSNKKYGHGLFYFLVFSFYFIPLIFCFYLFIIFIFYFLFIIFIIIIFFYFWFISSFFEFFGIFALFTLILFFF